MEHQDQLWHQEWDLPLPDRGSFTLDGELKVNTKLKKEDVVDVATWLEQQGFSVSTECDIIKFIHGCDYNVNDAKNCAKVFYSFRNNNPEIFSNWDVELPNFKSIIELITIAVLPRRTPDNCRIIFSGLRTADTKRYIFKDVCKLLLMCIESIFLTEPTIDGVILIFDLPLAHMGHFWKFGLSLPRKLATYMQGGLPLKLAFTHVTRCPALIDNGMKMIKHLVSQKDWDKVFIHRSDDFSVLHRNIPPYCLPSDLGGTLPPVAELTDFTMRRLHSFKDHFFDCQL